MAGLSCAHHLQKAGIPFRILEASDGVGGRVRTDKVDGFLLDRGFQIFLTSYPEAQEMLDYASLDLRPFYAGRYLPLVTFEQQMPETFSCLLTNVSRIQQNADGFCAASAKKALCSRSKNTFPSSMLHPI